MMNRVEDDQLHLLHVWISVFCQILLIYKNIDDFGNEIITGFAFVILLLDAALQGHREIGEHRSVDHSRLLDVPSRLFHLFRVVLGRNNAHEIRSHHGFLGSEGNGKLAAKLQVVCGDVISHRNHNLLHVPLSCPGSVYSTLQGEFDSSKGDLRLLGVTAGAGGRSYMNFLKVPVRLADFCNEINRRRELLLETPSEMDAYLLSFDAHNILVSIHPWVDGNGRMSRLIMNHLQFEFNLVPTKVMTDDKAAYIEALNASREEESMLPFQSFMLQEHIKNLKAEIEQYERSMDDDVVINVGKEKLIELSERQQNIISAVKLHPAITIPELAQRMSGKKTVTTRTIERDIAALQAKGILKREGGRKSGKWIVVNI